MSLVIPFLLSAAVAQRSLADVQRQFQGEARQLQASGKGADEQTALLARQVEALQKFVADEARGDDRWNGRLMLADLQLAKGDRKAAQATLASLDSKEAPALLLVTAATMAQHLGMKAERDAWIAAGLAKPAEAPDRFALARLLMTALHEIEKGEGVFAAELAASKDDEGRALVRWHRADALRDREDLPDNAGFDELDKLAKELPNTYWGGVAKDRVRATRLAVGDDAIDFTAIARSGTEVKLSAFAGKTVALAFWSASDRDTPGLLQLLREQQRALGDKLAVILVSLDRDADAIAAAVKELGIEFAVIGDGRGSQGDVAMRWFVEGPVVHLIDARGKVAGLGLHAGTNDGRAQLQELIERTAKN
jgi:peroxiredoxin